MKSGLKASGHDCSADVSSAGEAENCSKYIVLHFVRVRIVLYFAKDRIRTGTAILASVLSIHFVLTFYLFLRHCA